MNRWLSNLSFTGELLQISEKILEYIFHTIIFSGLILLGTSLYSLLHARLMYSSVGFKQILLQRVWWVRQYAALCFDCVRENYRAVTKLISQSVIDYTIDYIECIALKSAPLVGVLICLCKLTYLALNRSKIKSGGLGGLRGTGSIVCLIILNWLRLAYFQTEGVPTTGLTSLMFILCYLAWTSYKTLGLVLLAVGVFPLMKCISILSPGSGLIIPGLSTVLTTATIISNRLSFTKLIQNWTVKSVGLTASYVFNQSLIDILFYYSKHSMLVVWGETLAGLSYYTCTQFRSNKSIREVSELSTFYTLFIFFSWLTLEICSILIQRINMCQITKQGSINLMYSLDTCGRVSLKSTALEKPISEVYLEHTADLFGRVILDCSIVNLLKTIKDEQNLIISGAKEGRLVSQEVSGLILGQNYQYEQPEILTPHVIQLLNGLLLVLHLKGRAAHILLRK